MVSKPPAWRSPATRILEVPQQVQPLRTRSLWHGMDWSGMAWVQGAGDEGCRRPFAIRDLGPSAAGQAGLTRSGRPPLPDSCCPKASQRREELPEVCVLDVALAHPLSNSPIVPLPPRRRLFERLK